MDSKTVTEAIIKFVGQDKGYEDENHKSFQKGVEYMRTVHNMNPAHVDKAHTLSKVDKEIANYTAAREKLAGELKPKIDMGSEIAKERLQRADDHIEHLHRYRAGVNSWKLS